MCNRGRGTTALGAEFDAIAAYQLGAESKLLKKPALDLALSFQGHHKEHADVLAKTVESSAACRSRPKQSTTFLLNN